MTAAGTGMLVVFGDPVPTELARTLDLAGYSWCGVSNWDDAVANQPATGWSGAIVDLATDADAAWAFIRSLRKGDTDPVRTLVLVPGTHLADLELRDDLFDDFCLSPFHPSELETRLRHMLASVVTIAPRGDLVTYDDLALNLETYQASISDRPLDLTYMEYELLKFLAQNPGKVFTREMLLSRVWGYEYYGGARTVDVHVRRLRAKLGEEHADLIQTVRSVGYRFGQSRWGV